MKTNAMQISDLGVVSLQRMTSLLCCAFFLWGCGQNPADTALETDANGYLCQDCGAKFYTDRGVFADHCSSCKSMRLSPVVAFVCPEDKALTISPRGTGSGKCVQCQKSISGLAIPKSKDLQAWGAIKKSKAEVCGG